MRIFDRMIRRLGYVRADFDATVTNKHNKNHWKNARQTDADSAIIPALPVLRARIRYEMRNNPYALGIARKYANYVVGTGPSLHITNDSAGVWANRIEDVFHDWTDRADYLGDMSYAELLHLGMRELFPAGESFYAIRNAEGPRGPEIRLQMIDAERITTPMTRISDDIRDGIELDALGRRVRYWVAKQHPGSGMLALSADGFLSVPAEDMVHIMFRDAPSQTHGAPMGACVLNIFANLRRWDEATIRNAELAALWSVFMTTSAPTDYDPKVSPEVFEIEPGSGMTLPVGADVKQIQPQHPGSQYDTFKRSKITDTGVAMDMPYNVLACDSKDHNYASGRLDWQGLIRAVRVTRNWLAHYALTPVFRRWYAVARVADPRLRGAPAYETLDTDWQFPGFDHVDPMKEARAAQIRLQYGMETYADYYGEQGKDWRDKFEQIQREQKLIRECGLAFGPAALGVTQEDTQ